MIRSFTRIHPHGISLMLAGMLCFSMASLQAEAPRLDPSRYPKPKVGSSFSRGLQSILGVNRIAAWVGSREIKKTIEKKVGGNIDVDLEPYSATDLAQGKAKKLTIHGNNLVYDDAFYASEVEIITDEATPLWIDLDNGDLKSPVEATVRVRLTSADINKSLASPPIQDMLQNIRVPILGTAASTTLRLIQPQVSLQPEVIQIKTRLGVKHMPDEQAVPLTMETGLEPENQTGKIRLKHLKLSPILGISNTDEIARLLQGEVEDMLRPAKLIPLEKGTFWVDSVAISKDDIRLAGRVLLLPPSTGSSSPSDWGKIGQYPR